MKLVILSDSHGLHEKIKIPNGDVFIHCGDFSHGDEQSLINFISWLSKLPHKIKLIIAGNHDSSLEINPNLSDWFGGVAEYLFNSGTSYKGINFWGSPYTPAYNNWAFNLNDRELYNNWIKVPNNTDVLITHGPPYGILDKNLSGVNCGCKHLLKRIVEVKPLLHCFGHIHEGSGMNYHSHPPTTFINATILNGNYNLAHQPIVYELGDGSI